MFGSLPRVPPQKCRFGRPLAERRKAGIDTVKPLDAFSVPAASSTPSGDRGFVAGCVHHLLAAKYATATKTASDRVATTVSHSRRAQFTDRRQSR